jgi:hypothetical protein
MLACAASALTAPPQLSELKSSLKLKLRKQQLLRATQNQNVTTPRRYASRAELKDTLVDTLQPNPFHWTEWPFRIGSLGAFYVSYPLAWQAVQALPSAQIKLSRPRFNHAIDATARAPYSLVNLRTGATAAEPHGRRVFFLADEHRLRYTYRLYHFRRHCALGCFKSGRCGRMHAHAAADQAAGGHTRAGREQT